ncbi:DUF1217 domain-containing protein [Maritimibacter sp. 55A14]|uniref:DUF1217 domain-containing protein n=1 Tax=Maritimibacter sp. 55A14 TaxID=2174844 RepID=UPI001E40E8FD|nr:DUF1217 domain-containing protein [Maritimibacter sp. 55A14]
MPGLAGWTFLNRTLETQSESFARSTPIRRDTDHFREVIASFTTAEALVEDRAALRVALGAFGLQDDIDNRFFIRKVLEGGSQDREALANRLANKNYLALAEAFRFGPGEVPSTGLSVFAEDIVARFESRSFEIAVGERDTSFRLALNVRRELADLAARDNAPKTLWLSVLGSPPLRQVFETTYGLPGAFAAFDLDRQVEILQTRTAAAFGNAGVAQFADPDRMEELVRSFLLRSELQSGPPANAPGMTALALLQGTGQVTAGSILTALL